MKSGDSFCLPSHVPLAEVTILSSHFELDFSFKSSSINCLAGLSSLTTAYLIDIAGVENFGKAIGIINLFRGFGCVGLIIAGKFFFVEVVKLYILCYLTC